MVANPMKKIKRNSILLGLSIGLGIGLILCVVLYFALTNLKILDKLGPDETITVYTLNKTIKSGSKITIADIEPKVMNKLDIPVDAVSITTDVVAKIDLTAGTIITSGMINLSDEKITADIRQQEYSMIALPSKLTVGDFIDIRLQMPNGGDYIVVSKKQVIRCDATNISLNMCEEEINLMSNAIIEYYVMPGSKLYATIYNEPGLQVAALGTYVPNESVANLIANNPNIKEYINSERYSDALKNIRNENINLALAPYYIDPDKDGKTEALSNIEKNIKEEIKSIKSAREAYFSSLNAAH